MENYPGALSGMLITGLTYPKMSAAAGIVWILGRWMYAVGYTSESEDNVGGKGRWWGGGFYLAAVAQVGFLVGVGWMGWDMLQ
jgi:glutathione S-transferase